MKMNHQIMEECRNLMKRIICMILALLMVLALTACGAKQDEEPSGSAPAGEEEAAAVTEKNMSAEDAKYQVEVAMQYLLEEAYGDKVVDARIYVEKVYTAEEEQKDEVLKTLKLGPDEYAFEVKYELLPAEGVDPIEFTAGTGEVDEESGWVVEKYNVGVLRPNDAGEPAYIITDFGTGF